MRTRGNYYGNVTDVRPNGQRYGWCVARQAKTALEARRAIDATGLRGSIQLWVASEHRRIVIAERDEAGNWWNISPYDRTLTAWDLVSA
jgi:hypothetical protein